MVLDAPSLTLPRSAGEGTPLHFSKAPAPSPARRGRDGEGAPAMHLAPTKKAQQPESPT